jgi:hypothetical protein
LFSRFQLKNSMNCVITQHYFLEKWKKLMENKHWNYLKHKKHFTTILLFICHLNHYIPIISYSHFFLFFQYDCHDFLFWWKKNENEMEISWYNRWLNSRACNLFPKVLMLYDFYISFFFFLTYVKINSNPIVERLDDERISICNRRKMLGRYVTREICRRRWT